MCAEIKWRNCLETRCRETDPPTDLLTMSPTKGAFELPAFVSLIELIEFVFRQTTSDRDVARTPVFVVRAKSLLVRNRFLAGSTDIGN